MKERLYTQKDLERSYNSGLDNRENHKTSPETIKMVGDVKIELTKYCTKVEDLIQKVDEGFKSNAEQHKEIMAMVKEAMNGKSDKWVETVMVWTIRSIGAGIVLFITWFLATTVFHIIK